MSSAMAHGAPQEAVSYLRRALKEPPGDTDRVDVLLELGAAAFAAGDGAGAIEAFEAGLAARADPATSMRVGPRSGQGTLSSVKTSSTAA